MVAAMLQFAIVAGMLTLIPGIDTALVLRAAVSAGRKPAFATVFGISLGVLVWGLAAAIGISAILTASRVAFDALRYAGAAYLVWMGVRMLRDARLRTVHAIVAGPALTSGVAFRRGLVTNLLNPKVGVFYMAVLPQFLPSDVNAAVAGAALACVHVVEGITWYALLITGTHFVRGWFQRPSVQAWLDRCTGVVLIGFGLRVALEHT